MKSLGNGKLTGRFDADCLATREILNRVGDKWSVLVVVRKSPDREQWDRSIVNAQIGAS